MTQTTQLLNIYIKQKWKDLKGGKDSFTLIVGDFNPLFSVGETNWKKMDSKPEGLHSAVNQ